MMRWTENHVGVTPDEARAQRDEWLVVRCQIGERQAFDELIQRWHDPIWKHVRRQVGEEDAAREITQEVWIRVLRGIGRLHDGSKLRAWLFGIARRTLMDSLRKVYAALPDIEADIADVPADEASDETKRCSRHCTGN